MTILHSETATVPASARALATQPAAAPAALAAPEAHADLRLRLERAKHAFSTRTVGPYLRRAEGLDLITEDHVPSPGEVLLARVTSVGHHKRLESPVSRRQILFPGDEIVVAYGSRYAADQFLAMIPGDLGPLHLAAAGGLASRVVEQHASVGAATALEVVGVVSDQHGPLTLARTAAHRVLDFTDFGCSSTFCLDLDEVRDLFLSMADELAGGAACPDVVLIEIADGIYQGETSRLLADPEVGAVVDRLVFAAGDALGAVGAVGALSSLDRAPAVDSGMVTSSPLATAEARRALEVPVIGSYDVALPEVARVLDAYPGVVVMAGRVAGDGERADAQDEDD